MHLRGHKFSLIIRNLTRMSSYSPGHVLIRVMLGLKQGHKFTMLKYQGPKFNSNSIRMFVLMKLGRVQTWFMCGQKLGHQVTLRETFYYTLQVTFSPVFLQLDQKNVCLDDLQLKCEYGPQTCLNGRTINLVLHTTRN